MFLFNHKQTFFPGLGPVQAQTPDADKHFLT